ncbi:hypothetical protein [Nonomuraea guangzhouensis]|uniref:Uncharacterized protein n=1 Tax=Nonomuraea guangzhouensis TaxID=1291555 RepID=A0ABW4GZR6_9ACTN|nr:hypothetical protein [Nonomuraea guangzhouensis]
MTATRYQVTAPCVTHIPTQSSLSGRGGGTLVTLYCRQLLPDGVPEEKVRQLLDSGLITEFDG